MKRLIKLLLFLLVLIVPFLVSICVVENTKDQYDNTYLAELKDKISLLKNTKEKKIVLIGGSSLPFGIRSDLIEQELPEYKVVNFGLYATLGTKAMMDLSKINIQEGDIIILSPELNTQTYSLYFNPEAVMQALDGFSGYQKYFSIEDNLSIFYNYFDFAREKMKYADSTMPNPTGIYRHDSFNAYGDLEVERKNNIMANGYDSTMNIVLDDTLLNSDFIKYINQFCSYVRKNNAKVYFNFSPCNELAIRTSLKKRNEFSEKLDLAIECDLLSNLEDCIMHSDYFYDTNFHLNSAGAIYYTSLIIQNLKRVLNITDNGTSEDPNQPTGPSVGGITIPEPPKKDDGNDIEEPTHPGLEDLSKYDGSANNDFVDYFNYRLLGSSYVIESIKDEYKDIEEIVLPSSYNGKVINGIKRNAFYGCISLKKIYIGKTYKVFEEESFNGCIALEGIYLYEADGNTINVPSTGLMDGAGKNAKIYIPKEAKDNYTNGYTWVNYAKYFETH